MVAQIRPQQGVGDGRLGVVTLPGARSASASSMPASVSPGAAAPVLREYEHVGVVMPASSRLVLAGLSVLLAASGLLSTSPAFASSVSVERTIVPPDGRIPGYTTAAIVFAAEPGERNVVAVRRDATGLTITDAGSSIRAGDGCRSLDGAAVRCEPGGSAGGVPARIDLGDRADSATAENAGSSGGLTVDGGTDGDDLRALGSRGVGLVGGAGNDTLVGAAGGDLLEGGPGIDRLDGGAGVDTASWAESSRAVEVDLRQGTGGLQDELDHLSDLENIVGSGASDVLIGTDGANRISGGQARAGRGDRIHGMGGEDELRGGRGSDSIEGGPGNDTVTGEGGSDVVDAGPGRDTVRLSGHGGLVRGGAGDDDLVTALDDPKARAHRIICDAGQDTAGSFGRAVVASSCERGSIGFYDLRYPRLRPDRRITLTQLRRPSGILSTCNRVTIKTPTGRTLADRIVTRYPTRITTRRIARPLPRRVSVGIEALGDTCRRGRTSPRQAVTVNLSAPASRPRRLSSPRATEPARPS